jgi:hypothetical protein
MRSKFQSIRNCKYLRRRKSIETVLEINKPFSQTLCFISVASFKITNRLYYKILQYRNKLECLSLLITSTLV